MSVISTESSSSIEDDRQIAFFTIKCGEIFHTPDRQFFLLNCGVCGKGFCALNEFIDHVNHAPCGPLTSADNDNAEVFFQGECESLTDDVPTTDQPNLAASTEDGEEAFHELIEYTNSDDLATEIENILETCENSSTENYLLPEIECHLFQEVEQLNVNENAYVVDTLVPVLDCEIKEQESNVREEVKSDQGANQGDELTANDPFTTRIIEMYRFNECLWNKGHPDYHNRAERNEIFQKMVDELNKEFECCLVVQELNYKLNKLRYAFYRELRKMKTFQSNNNNINEKFISNLWYFDHLTFLKGNSSALLEVPKSQILLDIIDGFHRCQCLWDKSHHDFRNRRVRHAAYDAIATTIEIKYAIRTTRRSVILQIKKLQALYSQSLRSEGEMHTENKESNPLRTLLLKKLAFLKGKIRGCKEIKCSYCDETFYSNSKYKLHYQKHTGDLPYACRICNKQFLHKPSLKAHEDTHLDVKDRAFTCEFCGVKIANRANYKVHVQRHKGDLRHECKLCTKRYGTTTELKNHMLDHTGEKPNVCDKCGNQYKSKSELTRHMRLHAARREFKCGYCVKAFHFQSQLDQHMLTHFSQPCDICGKEINGRRAFMRHKKEHN